MTDTIPDNASRKTVKITIIVIIFIIAMLVLISWLMTRGAEDNRYNQPGTNDSTNAQPSESIPAEPTNPNVTGGSSGAGNSTSNEPGIDTPSPAGGVDTNQVPAGGSSSAQ